MENKFYKGAIYSFGFIEEEKKVIVIENGAYYGNYNAYKMILEQEPTRFKELTIEQFMSELQSAINDMTVAYHNLKKQTKNEFITNVSIMADELE